MKLHISTAVVQTHMKLHISTAVVRVTLLATGVKREMSGPKSEGTRGLGDAQHRRRTRDIELQEGWF